MGFRPRSIEGLARASGRWAATVVALGGVLVSAGPVTAQSLGGSPASLDRQSAQARAHDFSYLETASRVRTFVDAGYLVAVRANRDFEFHAVSFPYARREVALFIERLSSQYRAACGEKLVVTSLTRPLSQQPSNASDRSVHPTGMAVDLRLSRSQACRRWLESTLLHLEGRGVIEATRERSPPHYHIAVFPRPYAGYVAAVTGRGAPATLADNTRPASPPVSEPVVSVLAAVAVSEPSVSEASSSESARSEEVRVAASMAEVVHTVARGESLWVIARRYGVTERTLRVANGMAGDRLLVGARLTIPGTGSSGAMVAAASGPARDEMSSHRVRRGESLWTIAREYGVSEEVIRMANAIRGDRLFEGDVIMIPAGEGAAGVVRYTVERGDSLWIIADRLGISVDAIRSANGLSTSRIYTGQVLSVPLAD
jgi:LysM repeat protein